MKYVVELVRVHPSRKRYMFGAPYIKVTQSMAVFPLFYKYFGGAAGYWTTNNQAVDNLIKGLEYERGVTQAHVFRNELALFNCPISSLEPVWQELEIKGLGGYTLETLLKQWESLIEGLWAFTAISHVYKCNSVPDLYVEDRIQMDVGEICLT